MKHIGQFTSRDNFVYRVILDDGLSGDDKELKLGVPPFIVKYEGDSDLNKPLKLSNATINILTSEIPWELVNQKATSIKVTLHRERKIETIDGKTVIIPAKDVWFGYVDPSVYSMGADKGLEEFSINCVDALSTLQYKYFAKDDNYRVINPQNKTFLDFIIEAIADLPYTNVYFPKMYNINGGDEIKLSDLTVSENAFIDKDCYYIESDGTPKFAYSKNDTYKDVLEKLMMFLNLTMVTDGNVIYMLPMDYLDMNYTYNVYEIEDGEIVDEAVETIKDSVTLNKLFQPTSYSLTEQYNQVNVVAKMKDYDSVFPSLFDNKYLVNTTNGSYNWGEKITEEVEDNQKGGKRIKDKCTWKFFKHQYWIGNYYDGNIPLIEKHEANTLADIQNYNCGVIVQHSSNKVVTDTTKYDDFTVDGGLSNYVLLTTYGYNDVNVPALFETNNIPNIFVFDGSYLNLKYEVLFRPNNGSPWHLPSSWIDYDKDRFTGENACIIMELSCTCNGVTQYYSNLDLTQTNWSVKGIWSTLKRKMAVPFQCQDNQDHLYGKTFKSLINSGYSDFNAQENGFIILPPPFAVGKWAQFNLKIYYRVVPTHDPSHNTEATWLKDLSFSIKIPKDESIKNSKADTEYSAVIADDYVKEGEKIEMGVNTYDKRVPSWTCVIMQDNQVANKFGIVGNTEQPHRMEEWKIYSKVKQHETPMKVLNTTIDVKPLPFAVYNHGNDKYILNEWEMDYYDNKCNVQLVELWYLQTD